MDKQEELDEFARDIAPYKAEKSYDAILAEQTAFNELYFSDDIKREIKEHLHQAHSALSHIERLLDRMK